MFAEDNKSVRVNNTVITFDSGSLQGKRKTNEDKHFVGLNIDGKDKKCAPINAYLVADGHGNGMISAFLYDYLPKIMLSNKVQYPLKKSFVKVVFNYLQNFLKEKYTKHSMEAGSTCLFVAQYIENGHNYINVINIGDSKCILCRKNLAIPLTVEHRPSSFEEHARISALGGDVTQSIGDDPRIMGLSVSRSVGDHYAYPYVVAEPDLYRYKLTNDDKFIVLGCDGLYDYCSDNEIVTFVLKNCYDPKTQKLVTTKVARKLAQYAIDKGSTDNVTVIVVFFSKI